MTLVDITEEELSEVGLVAGYMGPTTAPEGVKVVYDNNMKEASSMICGANEVDYHLIGNDFKGIDADYADLVSCTRG